MRRYLNFFLFLSFQSCYLEWPPHNSMFVFQALFEIFSKTENRLDNFTHPIILVGLLTQFVLLVGAVNLKMNKKLNAIAILLLGLLVLLFVLISVISLNLKMFLATLPFLSISVYFFWNFKKIE
jgi:hypothetical protein